MTWIELGNAQAGCQPLKIAPALCAGHTVVHKAAEDAPLAVLKMTTICERFVPPGVLNVLTGLGEEAGAALSCHPGARKLSFTGSTEVGKIIMRAAADRIVPVSLKLGGKSPAIGMAASNSRVSVASIPSKRCSTATRSAKALR